MTSITKRLTGIVLGAALIGAALAGGTAIAREPNAHDLAATPNHRFFFSEEEIWRSTGADGIQVSTGSDDAVGYAGWQTVRFLEENVDDLWSETDLIAEYGIKTTLAEATADYAMLERTELERIAGRDNLDWQTINFLEENLWDYGPASGGANEADPETLSDEELILLSTHLREGVQAVDLDLFSEEIPWQDRIVSIARFAGQQTAGIYPHPDDVPQIRNGELND